MKARLPLFHILLLLILFTSCENEPDYDADLLMGTVRVMDRNIPFPFLLEKTKSRFFLIDHQNNIIDSSGTAAMDLLPGNSILMKNHNFLVMGSNSETRLFDREDSLNFHYEHPLYAAQFVKAGISDAINLTSITQELQKNIYQSKISTAHFATPNRDLSVIKTLNFSEDKLETRYTYYYQNEAVYAEKEVSVYYIFERKGKVFFSEGQDQDNTQNLYQIVDVEDNSFSLRSFRNNEEVIENFKTSEPTENPSDLRVFERCMEGQPGEYYHDDLTFNKGNDFLVNKISKKAPPASGDGYITIHFTINCNGEMGHLGLEQMDRNFQSTSFESSLIKHIIKEVMDLQDWPEILPGLFYKDIHSFLMFRITNGKISDLCP